MNDKRLKALLVEDIPIYAALLQHMLAASEFSLYTAKTLVEGLKIIGEEKFDVILLDLGLPDCQGLQTFTAVSKRCPDTPVVILTSLDDEEVAAKAVQQGAQDYLIKGPYLTQGEAGKSLLVRSLSYAIERQQIQAALRRERDLLESRVAERTAELRQANLKLRWYYERMNLLREIDHAALGARTSEEIALIALRSFERLVPHNYADILILERNPLRKTGPLVQSSTQVTVIAKRTEGETQRTSERFPSSDLLINDRLRRGEHYLVHDLDVILELSFYEERLHQRGIRSYLMIPLIAERKLIGAISLGANKTNFFTDEHVDSAQQVARQLALMLRNSQLFEQVHDGRARLRYLAERLVSVQEEERHRISLELHDEAGQALTALKLNLALLQTSPIQEPEQIQNQLADAIKLAETTMDRIRTLAHDLRPPALDTVGLKQAMEDYCQRFGNQTGIKIQFSGIDMPDLPDHFQTSFYRVLQEALTNVIKHAQASRVAVNLGAKDDYVFLKVRDNGKGFIYKAVPSQTDAIGIGLLGIIERIEALGGHLDILSLPGQGTTLLAEVPWRQG